MTSVQYALSVSVYKSCISNELISDMQICHLVKDGAITKKSNKRSSSLKFKNEEWQHTAILTTRNSRPTIHMKAAILSEMSPIL